MSLDIAILTGFIAPGGVHTYCRELIPRLIQRGHRPRLICYESQPPFPGMCQVTELRPPKEFGPFMWRFADYARYRYCTKAIQSLDLPRPDITICMNEFSFEGHHRRWPDVPVIYLSHALVAPTEVESYGLRGIKSTVARWTYRRAQRQCLNRSDRTMRFTKFGCRVLSEYYGDTARPHFVINPMAVKFPEDGRGSEGTPRATLKLLFVSRLIPTKNLALVLEVLAQLQRYRWDLDVVGDGPSRAGLEKLAGDLGLSSRVRFLGHQSDPSPWYRQADLFVYPSRLDYCPTVILEAMSYGVPAIVIRSDGVKYRNGAEDLIEPGQTGYVSEDESAFQRDLETTLGDSARLAALGRAARERVRAEHVWERHLDRYESLFGELLVGQRPDS